MKQACEVPDTHDAFMKLKENRLTNMWRLEKFEEVLKEYKPLCKHFITSLHMMYWCLTGISLRDRPFNLKGGRGETMVYWGEKNSVSKFDGKKISVSDMGRKNILKANYA